MRAAILWAVVAALLCAPVAATAQSAPAAASPPSARQMELARQILDETGAAANLDGMIKTLFGQIAQGAQKGASPEAREATTAISEAMSAAMLKIKPRLIDVSVRAYAETFSEEELAGILAFYRTPIGRSMAAKMPLMTRNVTAASMTLLPDMQSAMAGELCARTTCPPSVKALAGAAATSPSP